MDAAASSPSTTTSAAAPDLPQRRVRKPIIILGCARSATSMMGRILARHPDVAYWPEPRPIWMRGNAYRSHYELTADDLTPRIARYIDRRFAKFLEQSRKSRFAEKTPSNVFRIPFIHAIYPDCRIINIIRDGRKVVKSILRIEKRPPSQSRLKARLQETPLLDWPAYWPMFFRQFVRVRLLGKPALYWGPKPKGWQEWTALPRHLMIAEQWRATVESATNHGRRLPVENYFEIRYEDLMKRPLELVAQILEFAELPAETAAPVLEYAGAHIDPNRSSRSASSLTPEQEEEVAQRLAPTLERLGYTT